HPYNSDPLTFPTRRSSDLEGQYRPVGDRRRLVQEAKGEQERDRDHRGAQSWALANDRQRLAGGRRDGTRVRKALRLVATTCTMRSEEHTSELQSRFDLVCR